MSRKLSEIIDRYSFGVCVWGGGGGGGGEGGSGDGRGCGWCGDLGKTDVDLYVLNTTSDFRKHVSRKLSEIIDRYSFGVGVFGSGWGWMEWRVGEDRWTLCSEYSFRLRKTCPENLVRSLTGTVLVWGGGGEGGSGDGRGCGWCGDLGKTDVDLYVLNTTSGFRKHVSRKLSEIIDRYSFGVGVFGSGWGWMEWRVGEDRWNLCSEYSFRLRKTCPENLVRSLTGTVLVCVCGGGGGGGGGRGFGGWKGLWMVWRFGEDRC